MKSLACILFILFNCNAIKSLAAFELEKYSLTSFLTNVSTVWIELEDVLQQDDLNWYNPATDGPYTSVIQLNNVPFKNPFDELVNSDFEVVLLGNGMARVVSGGGEVS